MQITVKLFATFREGRFKQADRDYPIGTTVANVVDDLAIVPSEIGMIFVKGRAAEMDYVLKENDALALFPLLGGG
ncbi:MoaD/ThiS family protein [Oryzibacter oryziterrae]|uniref:MoaD/ThiS family protein n=1 Tax=Oryzibacter oryziterrae TaxID=2766474 RepID=UPI001F192FBD|nr:MoaD/ThiS family protein [Oryzibacter oryziterrae]